MKEIIIASRGSILALWQAKFIQNELENQYANLSVKIKTIKTKGDKILDTPLAKIGGKGLFTKELEESMLQNDAQIAVHSLKDVPTFFPQGLVLGAITKRADVRDSFLSYKYANLNELPKGAVVGTTSLRRRMQLLRLRDDLNIKSLRGNVQTRLDKLRNGEFDAIILAQAGIDRLEIKNVDFIVPFECSQMIPAMGQAALGVEAVDDDKLLAIINFLNNESALIETKIERDFVKELEGGCQIPIGINACIKGDEIEVRAIVGMPDASEIIEDFRIIKKDEFATFGKTLADEFVKKGAKELLKRAETMALNEIL